MNYVDIGLVGEFGMHYDTFIPKLDQMVVSVRILMSLYGGLIRLVDIIWQYLVTMFSLQLMVMSIFGGGKYSEIMGPSKN